MSSSPAGFHCPRGGTGDVEIGIVDAPRPGRGRRTTRPVAPGELGTLAERRGEWIVVECAGCTRHGELRAKTLAAVHGWDVGLPDLLGRIADAGGCPIRSGPLANSLNGHTRCGIGYVSE